MLQSVGQDKHFTEHFLHTKSEEQFTLPMLRATKQHKNQNFAENVKTVKELLIMC